MQHLEAQAYFLKIQWMNDHTQHDHVHKREESSAELIGQFSAFVQ